MRNNSKTLQNKTTNRTYYVNYPGYSNHIPSTHPRAS